MRNIRWLWKYSSPIKWMLLLSVVLLTMESLANIASIALQQRLIDHVFVEGKYEEFAGILILMGIAFAAHSALFTLGPHTVHLNMAYFHSKLAGNLIKVLHRMPISKLHKERTANFVHYFSSDVEQVYGLLGSDIPRAIQQGIQVLVLMGIIAYANPGMLLVLLVLTILYIYLGRYFAPRIKDAAKGIQESKSDLLLHMEEGISATREIVAFHREGWEERKYGSIFRKYFDAMMREGKLLNLKMVFTDPLKWGVGLLMIGYGGYLVIQGSVSIGTFIVIYQLSTQLMDGTQVLFNTYMGLSGRMASVDRLRELFDGEPFKDGYRKLDGPLQSLSFEDVRFSYGPDMPETLKKLNMELPIGKKIAFVGQSGGGKSTIAQLLIRFFDPVEGTIRVNGIPLADIERKEWMSRVGIVFQDPYIFQEDIRSNLMMGQQASESAMKEACVCAEIDSQIMSMSEGYMTQLGERGITLSGGQRQRVTIARAILRNPEILIMDEATSALDMETERRVQENLDRQRTGRTTIIIAHRLSTVQNADRIYVLSEGEIADAGTHEELMGRSALYIDLVQKREIS